VEGERVTVFAAQEFQRPVRLNARESLAPSSASGPSPRKPLERSGGGAARAWRNGWVVRSGNPQGHGAGPARRAEPAAPEVEAADSVELSLGDDGFRRNGGGGAGKRPGVPSSSTSSRAPPSRRSDRLLPTAWSSRMGSGTCWGTTSSAASAASFAWTGPWPFAWESPARPACPGRRGRAAPARDSYHAHDDTEVVVRYSPRVARWIAEKVPAEGLADGGVRVRHQVADPRWMRPHVLQYGGEAVIEAPRGAYVVRERRWPAPAPDSTRACLP